MGYFQYQARDLQGAVHKGVLEALSELDVARKLKSSRLYPVKIKAVKSQRLRRVPEEHIIRFFYDLSDLLYAGLPVDRALALISTNQSHKVFGRVVQDLLGEVQGGMDLSGAIGKCERNSIASSIDCEHKWQNGYSSCRWNISHEYFSAC